MSYIATTQADKLPQAQQARIEALQAEIDELQKVLGYVPRVPAPRAPEWILTLGVQIHSENENAEQIVSRHIKLLHQYNETKDATQVRIASPLLSARGR